MKGICDGRVVIVTGAGRGLGREYALEFARQGARVVVNDLGRQRDGAGASDGGPAQSVVDEIRALGGEAIANTDDVADWDGARRMVRAAIDGFGGLDVLVNNAGILRDRTLANMEPEDWDAVIHVHLRGTFAPSRHATAWWRDEFKAGRSDKSFHRVRIGISAPRSREEVACGLAALRRLTDEGRAGYDSFG